MQRSFIISVLAILMLLAGCTSGKTAIATATATTLPNPTATLNMSLGDLPVQTLALPGYHVAEVHGTASGFVFTIQDPTGEGGTFSGKLYFYRYSTKQVKLIDTAQATTAGEKRNFQSITVADDRIAYATTDQSGTSWKFWLANLQTGQRLLLGSYLPDWNDEFPPRFALDAHHVVWSTIVQQYGKSRTIIQEYDIAQNTATTILEDSVGINPAFYYPTIAGNTIVYTKVPSGGNLSTPDTIWKMNSDGTNPQKIATTARANLDITMNDHYVVWDEIADQNSTVHAYDLTSQALVTLPNLSCKNPTISGLYMMCQAVATSYLINIQSGKWTTIGQSANTTLTHDRSIWVDANSQLIAWVMLP